MIATYEIPNDHQNALEDTSLLQQFSDGYGEVMLSEDASINEILEAIYTVCRSG